jgi:tripartite-type tricarboxylate transporter receptor subunit TctC
MDRRAFLTACAAGAAAMTEGFPLRAQGYPDRPIKLLQGFAPGGNADIIARVVGGEISKALGQPVVVEAQTGAGGTIAAATVSRARADGHTLLLATGGHAVASAIFNTLPYQTVGSFDMISTITYFPFLIVTNAGSKIQDFQQVMSMAKSQPNGIAFGSAGIGSTHHLAGELLAKMGKMELVHVPYRGDTAAITGLLTNDIPIIIAPPTAVMSNVQAGKLRVLATTGRQRWKGLPDVPTVAELGVTGYDVRSWAGLIGPAGLPRPVVDRLNAETRKALQIPAVRSKLEEMGGEVQGSTPEEMKAMVSAEVQRWGQVVTEARISKQ